MLASPNHLDTSPTFSVQEVRHQMLFTSDDSKSGRQYGPQFVRIYSGCFLRIDYLRQCQHEWQVRRVIEIARTLALAHRNRACVPTGRSAGVLHGLRVTSSQDVIHLRALNKRVASPLLLPAVVVDDQCIAPETTAIIHFRPNVSVKTVRIVDIDCDDLVATALVGALIHEPPVAHLLASEVLRVLCRFDKWHQAACRRRAERVREFLLSTLAALPRGTRDRSAAGVAIGKADPGCESPGETRLLEVLQRHGFSGMVTQLQVPIDEAGHSVFIDLAFPEDLVGVEFDGRVKFSRDPDLLHEEEEALLRRQRMLEARGWTIIRVRWKDLMDEAGLVAQISHHLKLSRAGLQVGSAAI